MAEGMDQISRPMRFALVAVVGFAVVWFMALRPKAETAAPVAVAASTQSTAAPGAGGLGTAVGKAEGAVAASETAVAGAPAPGAAPLPATAAPAREAEKKAPKADGRTTVLLFAGSGADDAVAREVVRSFRGPGVRVVVASLGDVAKYQDLLGALEIEASPTILVFGKDRAAQRIEGLPDEAQVRQALRAAK